MCGDGIRLSFTPKALNNKAQGRGASPRTLGADGTSRLTLKGLHKVINILCNPFRIKTAWFVRTQGARRSAATLGFVVQRLRRKPQALRHHLVAGPTDTHLSDR